MIFKKLWNRLVKEKIAKFRQNWVLQFREKQADQAKQTKLAKQVETVEKPEKAVKLFCFFRFLSYLFAIVGVGQLFFFKVFSLLIPYSPELYIVFSVVFSTTYLAKNEVGWKKVTSGIAWFILEVFLWGVCLTLISFVELSFSGLEPVRDVSAYDKIVCEWQGDLIAHFPRTIPAEAKNVRLYHSKPFLMGGFILQLRYSCDPLLVAQLYSFYSKIKTKSFMGGNSNDHSHVAGGMPTTSFYTSVSGDSSFPNDYKIMLFNKVVKAEDSDGGYWNHGKSRGVAISRKRGVIVYWAESW